MERKRIPPKVEEGEIVWRKIGGGSFRFKGKIIKPNQKFIAREDEISAGFRDVIIKVGDAPASTPPPEIEGISPVYEVKPRGKGGWYDVVDQNGKVLNEKALKKDIAEKLVQDLVR